MFEDNFEADRTPVCSPSNAPPRGVLAHAEQYRARGFVPVPVTAGLKAPIGYGWNKRTPDTPLDDITEEGNLGVLLGEPSGGLVDIDLDCAEAIVAAKHLLPDTGLRFGRKSRPESHWLYRVADCGKGKQFQSPDGKMLVEYRANGMAITVPPSIHETGEEIAFTENGDPSVVSRDDLLKAVSRLAACSLLAQHWTEGSRHNAALALSGGLLRAGWKSEETKKIFLAVCNASGDEEIEDRLRCIDTTADLLDRGELATGWPALSEIVGAEIVAKVAEWLGCNQPAADQYNQPTETERYNVKLTELGNVERFYKRHKDAAAYCPELNSWLLWNGGRWEPDKAGRVTERAASAALSIFNEISEIKDRKEREELIYWAKRSCTKPVIDHVLGLARSRLHIPVRKLDTNTWLLNCLNGTINLKTGELLEHDRRDWLTMQIPIAYRKNAECQLFERFLNETTSGDRALFEFIQRALGYSLTGSMDEQCLFVAYGEGANGKSTLLNLFRELLGDYSKNAPAHTLASKQSDGSPRSDLVRLRGMRFVTVMEAEDKQRMSDALIKQITGGDALTARGLYQDYVEFTPEFKPWLATNHRPKFASDDAIWRRIRLIPFSVVIPPEKRDPKLPEKLRSEAQGILAWAVRGCLDWQRYGLTPPKAVLEATSAYRQENDDVAQFAKECLEPAEGKIIKKDAMLEAYAQWAQKNGGEKLSKQTLGKRLKRVGLEEAKSGQRFWTGVCLISSECSELESEEKMGTWALGQSFLETSLEKPSYEEVPENGGSICPSVLSNLEDW